jgi:hypothetical protein
MHNVHILWEQTKPVYENSEKHACCAERCGNTDILFPPYPQNETAIPGAVICRQRKSIPAAAGMPTNNETDFN